jgi:hypothetical protein
LLHPSELRESLGAPAKEVPQGEPWDVLVATNLVLLRKDATLPAWKKQTDGRDTVNLTRGPSLRCAAAR